MAKDKLFQDILDLLEEDKKTQEWLLDKIKAIMVDLWDCGLPCLITLSR
jgi:hypothetical protein